ncbi:YeeE/YedE thiosulfate transporter family protein [Methanosarcina sp. KYL-1]|uniref:YeeE/YedE thiosulfate transporter family protein n=1 Tax=Methanosarcina sp. KYL-1 TaxID=2602068 RepID=UPI002100F9C2|nr:YeeE/YedE thiosulfate transporter family protein [Methanosarcina sp. KYL-1]
MSMQSRKQVNVGWVKSLHSRKGLQLGLGFFFGIIFGFLLQKGGVTRYNVIIGQLLLSDFTVMKVILSAIITGMIGVRFLNSLGFASLHPKPGSLGMNLVGGLLFGVGFGILGYCPGTIAGAVGNGFLDALFGGLTGILLGDVVFAELYPRIEGDLLKKVDYGDVTLPELVDISPWLAVFLAVLFLGGVLWGLEKLGL